MEYAALFFILILLLFFLSRVLTSEIYSFFYKTTRSENFSIGILSAVLFIGVFVHEMAHFLTAKFLLVPTGKVSLFPKKDGDYLKLGSVSVAQSCSSCGWYYFYPFVGLFYDSGSIGL